MIGILHIIFLLFILIVLCILAITMILNIWYMVPFVPTPKAVVKAMVDAANVQSGQYVYDLGAGDARIVVAAKKRQPEIIATGYEIAPLPWFLGKWRILRNGMNIKWNAKDFMKKDFSNADIIFLYLSPEHMKMLSPKFAKELKPGTKVISHAFTFKDRQPIDVVKVSHRFSPKRQTSVHVYRF